MSTAIQPAAPAPMTALLPAPGEFETMLRMADTLVEGGLLPSTIKTPQAAFTVIQKGRELSIPPMAALNGIYVINGKPTCSAELMAALIYRDHGDLALSFVQTDNHACRIEYRRRGWPAPQSYAFTIEDAQQAGLLSGPNGGNWKKYPAAMLRARCISAVARFAFADTIGGMYTPEELGALVDEQGEVVRLEAGESDQDLLSMKHHMEHGPGKRIFGVSREPAPVEASFREVASAPEPEYTIKEFYAHAREHGLTTINEVAQLLGLSKDVLKATPARELRERFDAAYATPTRLPQLIDDYLNAGGEPAAVDTQVAQRTGGSIELDDLTPAQALEVIEWLQGEIERLDRTALDRFDAEAADGR